MKKMKENPHEHKNISPYTMEGYLYVQEKRRCWAGEWGGGSLGKGFVRTGAPRVVQQEQNPWRTGIGPGSGKFSGISLGMWQPGRITASPSEKSFRYRSLACEMMVKHSGF